MCVCDEMTEIRTTSDQEVHEVHLEVDSGNRVMHNGKSGCLLLKTVDERGCHRRSKCMLRLNRVENV